MSVKSHLSFNILDNGLTNNVVVVAKFLLMMERSLFFVKEKMLIPAGH
jgi:hypothetical protein